MINPKALIPVIVILIILYFLLKKEIDRVLHKVSFTIKQKLGRIYIPIIRALGI